MESKKIYGPIGYYYFEFINKKILLFSDRHQDIKFKSNDFNIKDFFKNILIFSKNKTCFDFFFEKRLLLNENNKILGEGTMLTKIRKDFNKNYISKYNLNARIHNIDIGQILYQKNSKSYDDPIAAGLFIKFKNKQSINKFFSKNEQNLKNIFFGIYLIMVNEENLEQRIDDYNNYIQLGTTFLNLISQNENLEFNDYIRNKIKKQIDNLNTEYFKKVDLYNYIKDYFTELSVNLIQFGINDNSFLQIFLYLRVSLIDTYTICRMFRTFNNEGKGLCNSQEPNNIIYYGGAFHTYNLYNFIKTKLNIEPIKEEFEKRYLFQTNEQFRISKPLSFINLESHSYFGYDFNKLTNFKYLFSEECNNISVNNEDNYEFFKGKKENDIISYNINERIEKNEATKYKIIICKD